MIRFADVLIVLLLVVNIGVMCYGTYQTINGCNTFKMYEHVTKVNTSEFNNGVWGVAKQDYYCVWTNGRTNKEVIDTREHELCHTLIFDDYEHFCRLEATNGKRS
jgi:hypothetical protein